MLEKSDAANVSVIIPARNAADTLAEALESLRVQTFVDWEAIVVDDGSTDDTAAVAARFAERDPRIQIVSQSPQGVSAARNAGLRLAHFDWVLFLDADDWLLPQHLQRLTDALTANPDLDAVHCGWTRIAPDGMVVYEDFGPPEADLFTAFGLTCAFAVHACVVHRSLVEAVGGFDPSFRTCEDWDLWQRIARTGARFGAIREALACYRLRPDSASVEAAQNLADGLRVIAQAHAPDPRVPNPAPAHARGLSSVQIAAARLYWVGWAAEVALGRGEDARPLLKAVADDRDPDLKPEKVAAYIFYSALLPTCRPLATWAELWPEIERRLDDFLCALEAQSTTPGLACRTRTILERMTVEHALAARPLTIGITHAIRIEVTEPVPDLSLPAPVERLHCAIELEGTRLGVLELPVCDGFVAGRVLADAIAAQFAWPILGRFFERTVYPRLEVERSPTGWSLRRGELSLAEGLPGDERSVAWADAHDRVGWSVFLQEVWARPDWPEARFYEAGASMSSASACSIEEDWLVIEVSDDFPDLEISGDALTVVLTVGGVALGSTTLPVEGRFLSAQQIRAALITASGFELCRACVREGLLGRPLSELESLRARLAEAAARRAEHSVAPPVSASFNFAPGAALALRAALPPGGRGMALGRRAHAAIGTSASRRAILPAAAARELADAAVVAGEPVLCVPDPDAPPERVAYLPDLLWLPSHASSPLTAGSDPTAATQAVQAAAYDRSHFETLFAKRPDPWQYTTPYEQIKYEQTLMLLPRRKIKRALELACAEGLFTVRLAPRVKDLLAADISEIALARASERCAGLNNIHFARLDLACDPLLGRFELIVCSEVLYYVGGLEQLRAVARKLAEALEPGGYLVMAHAHLIVDEPDRPGYDWGLPFGAKVIGETFAQTEPLRLVKEQRTPLYRVQLFQRALRPRPARRRAVPQIIEMPQPTPIPSHLASNVRWQGGAPSVNTALSVVADQLPILMYHRVAPTDSSTPDRYCVTSEAFDAQLRYLRETGFYSIALDDWRTAMETRRSLPGRAVLITFDDGYQDFLTYAWPLLKRYGFSAMVFLVTDKIGGVNEWDRRQGELAPLLSWPELRRLQSEGVAFGSHSVSHPFLTALSPAEVIREGAHSRAILEQGLGLPVQAFAFPYGDVDPGVQHLIGASGYVFGLTCEPRWCRFRDSLLALPRIEVSGSDGLPEFIAKLGA